MILYRMLTNDSYSLSCCEKLVTCNKRPDLVHNFCEQICEQIILQGFSEIRAGETHRAESVTSVLKVES